MSKRSVVPLVASLLMAPAIASAHTVLVNPQPLTSDDNAKTAPCGCTFGTGTMQCAPDYHTTTIGLGDTFTVTWNETIDHTGEFRVAFVPKPPEEVTAEDFDNAALQTTIPDDNPGGLVELDFTLPDTPCENCTIQVRQFMEGTTSPYYYSCASVRIGQAPVSGDGGESAVGGGTTSGAGGAPGSGGSTSSAGVGDETEPTWAGPEDSSGCTASAGATPSDSYGWGAIALFLGFAPVVVARRRRARRVT